MCWAFEGKTPKIKAQLANSARGKFQARIGSILAKKKHCEISHVMETLEKLPDFGEVEMGRNFRVWGW